MRLVLALLGAAALARALRRRRRDDGSLWAAANEAADRPIDLR